MNCIEPNRQILIPALKDFEHIHWNNPERAREVAKKMWEDIKNLKITNN
ncbi:hypothetical protein [Cytobacillus sp. Bac17]|nr:hypothetical protein [Cytobacillus sp. Bac17]